MGSAPTPVPRELLPVYADAIGEYPHLATEEPGDHSPFGFQRWERGYGACDTRRLHAVGELPDEGWVHLLQRPDQICVNNLDSAAIRSSVLRDSPDVFEIPVDQENWVNYEPFADGQPPDGFLIRGSYLLDALDFLLGEEEGEVSAWYSQGVFKFHRESARTEPVDYGPGQPTNIVRLIPERTCFVAGHLGRQWALPLDQEPLVRGMARVHKWPRPSGSSPGAVKADSLPLPLACSYRLSLSSTSGMAETKALLRTGENLLAFLGSMSLALLGTEQRSQLDDLRPDHEDCPWRGGIGPGDWLGVARRCAKLFAVHDDGLRRSLGRSLSTKKGGIFAILNSIVERKNDFKHDRAFGSEEAAEEENLRLWAHINTAYENLQYLSRHPIRFLYDLDVDAEKHCFILRCLVYQGVSPCKDRRREWYEPLQKHRLYLEVSDLTWVSLFPFIHRGYCPQCHDTELFYLDKLSGDGNAVMKSFERGHVADMPEVAAAMERWFEG